MDLIYTDSSFEDIGVLFDYSLDLAYGKDENDFELIVDVKNNCCDKNSLVYIDGTEYGGIIDGIAVDTANNKLTYSGRTWHGVLGSKIIEPEPGEAYYSVSGEANTVINSLIQRLGLSDLFEADQTDSELYISNYQFNRYVNAYEGIISMLDSIAAKMRIVFKNGRAVISALPIIDYSENEQFDNDQLELRVEKTFNPVNHLICLGKGELTDRLCVHLYADSAGNISENQTLFGVP